MFYIDLRRQTAQAGFKCLALTIIGSLASRFLRECQRRPICPIRMPRKLNGASWILEHDERHLGRFPSVKMSNKRAERSFGILWCPAESLSDTTLVQWILPKRITWRPIELFTSSEWRFMIWTCSLSDVIIFIFRNVWAWVDLRNKGRASVGNHKQWLTFPDWLLAWGPAQHKVQFGSKQPAANFHQWKLVGRPAETPVWRTCELSTQKNLKRNQKEKICKLAPAFELFFRRPAAAHHYDPIRLHE